MNRNVEDNGKKTWVSNALSSKFMRILDDGQQGIFSPIIQLVRDNKDLHLEFKGNLDLSEWRTIVPRDEAVIVLNKGNRVFTLHREGKLEMTPEFVGGMKEEGLPVHLGSRADAEKYVKKFVPSILFNIAIYHKSSMEIEYEQMIIRENNREKRNNSEYIVLANQYDVGEIGERWDLIALKWPRLHHGGKNPVGQLVLIEVKYALNRDIQDAHRQLERYYDFIKLNMGSLCTEMELILSQKLDLRLIERTPEQSAQLHELKLLRDESKVEIILYLVDYNPNSTLKNKMISEATQLPFKSQIRIKIGGLAMWDQSSMSVDEAAK